MVRLDTLVELSVKTPGSRSMVTVFRGKSKLQGDILSPVLIPVQIVVVPQSTIMSQCLQAPVMTPTIVMSILRPVVLQLTTDSMITIHVKQQ